MHLLEPGGVAAFTTLHDAYFDFCAWAARQQDSSPCIHAPGALLPDLDSTYAACRRGEWVYASSQDFDGTTYDQACYVPRKPR